jgi:hypothetical protein
MLNSERAETRGRVGRGETWWLPAISLAALTALSGITGSVSQRTITKHRPAALSRSGIYCGPLTMLSIGPIDTMLAVMRSVSFASFCPRETQPAV